MHNNNKTVINCEKVSNNDNDDNNRKQYAAFIYFLLFSLCFATYYSVFLSCIFAKRNTALLPSSFFFFNLILNLGNSYSSV